MSETGAIPKVLLPEQEGEAAMMVQAINFKAEINPVLLAGLSEKARIAGDSNRADHLLLLAWASYDEAEKLQTDIGLCSSESVVAHPPRGHKLKRQF